MRHKLRPYLEPTRFIDYNTDSVAEFAHEASDAAKTEIDTAVDLYYAVRDRIRYDPYCVVLDPEHMTASATVDTGVGYCVTKSILLAAAARAMHIPSRLGYADVRNHLSTDRLRQHMRTDVFVFHGYTELLLGGRWVKSTPIFNRSLCERFGVKPLEFDGRNDSMFHEFDTHGNHHMEYLRHHGQFADLPYELMVTRFQEHYPHMYGSIDPKVGDEFTDET